MCPPNPTDDEIELLGPILKKLSAGDVTARRKLQEHGINVVPIGFYANNPSIADIEGSYEYNENGPPYMAQSLFDAPLMNKVLGQLEQYSHEFDPDLEGDEQHAKRFFWKNGTFTHSDAMSYYCLIRELKPQRIVEIGGGLSTLVALDAVAKNKLGRVTCIEPYPRPFLRKNSKIDLVEKKAQEIDADYLNDVLEDGDILFIDSTHTVKTGSDCLHLYLRLLPRIKRDILVHVHDVFLPFGMPKSWLLERQIFWTEQFLLLALITDNPKVNVLYGSAFHEAYNTNQLWRLMHGRYACGGSSFWFEYNGAAGSDADNRPDEAFGRISRFASRRGPAVRFIVKPTGESSQRGLCNVCGSDARFLYDRGSEFREAMFCSVCGTTSRNRSIARGILRALQEMTGIEAQSIAGLSKTSYAGKITVHDTQPSVYYQNCTYPIPDLLTQCAWIDVRTSRFDPTQKPGARLAVNVTNQNPEALTLAENSIDLFITSDLLNRVRLHAEAHREIRRVLRPGGYYIFTVPHMRDGHDSLHSIVIVDPADPSRDFHHTRGGGAGAGGSPIYRRYGTELDEELRNLGFEVEYSAEDLPKLGIINTELFFCRLSRQ
jgi:SAM-dependent methyltransferase/predicted O-methyltransferase YrrM